MLCVPHLPACLRACPPACPPAPLQLGWLYVNSLLSHKHAPTQLYAACWFLAGFVAGSALASS